MSESRLFEPLKVRGITIPNRIVMSPMAMFSATAEGIATDFHVAHYETRAIGRVGLIMVEATGVSKEGRISQGCLGIWSEDHEPMLKRIVERISVHGSIPAIQIAHAGRKASVFEPWAGRGSHRPVEEGGWIGVAPSPVPFGDLPTPIELDASGIQKVKNDFVRAAKRAVKCGFKVIEVHAAHGYLLNEFLSPYANKRTDIYGGSFENRTRLLLEIVELIREEISEEIPLFVRLSVSDLVETNETWAPQDSAKLAILLKTKGVDLLDCSAGGMSTNAPYSPWTPGMQVPYAVTVKEGCPGVLIGAVGKLDVPQLAEDMVREGKCDMIFIARGLLKDPYWPITAARSLGHSEPQWINPYNWSLIKY